METHGPDKSRLKEPLVPSTDTTNPRNRSILGLKHPLVPPAVPPAAANLHDVQSLDLKSVEDGFTLLTINATDAFPSSTSPEVLSKNVPVRTKSRFKEPSVPSTDNNCRNDPRVMSMFETPLVTPSKESGNSNLHDQLPSDLKSIEDGINIMDINGPTDIKNVNINDYDLFPISDSEDEREDEDEDGDGEDQARQLPPCLQRPFLPNVTHYMESLLYQQDPEFGPEAGAEEELFDCDPHYL